MIIKNLHAYATSNWSDYEEEIREVSKSEGKSVPLVDSGEKVYNFDKISLEIFGEAKKPTSADGITITKKCVELVEFKTGFYRKITKKNFSDEKGFCKPANKVCKEYWDLFFRNQKKEIEELITSIRCKAVESYVTLEKHIFPLCSDIGKKVIVKFVVVIDGDSIENMEDTYAELSGGTALEDNYFSAIRSALKRVLKCCDAEGKPYYYDSIEVMSARDYAHYLQMKG